MRAEFMLFVKIEFVTVKEAAPAIGSEWMKTGVETLQALVKGDKPVCRNSIQ
jgi:hypothetical protein